MCLSLAQTKQEKYVHLVVMTYVELEVYYEECVDSSTH